MIRLAKIRKLQNSCYNKPIFSVFKTISRCLFFFFHFLPKILTSELNKKKSIIKKKGSRGKNWITALKGIKKRILYNYTSNKRNILNITTRK